MTELAEFIGKDLEERRRCTFIPIGKNIYNGLGYMLGPKSCMWLDPCKQTEFHDWAIENGVKYDGVVYEFPDVGTYIMARMIFE
jgi:hypothetical protein